MVDKVATTADQLMGARQGQETGVVVIGGDYRGLGVVRSLGRRGIPVWVLTDEHLIAATSRYTRRSLPWPITEEEDQQLDYLLTLGKEHRLDGWLLFPTNDEVTKLLARNHTRLLEQYRLTVSPWEMVRWAYDKRLTYRLASELGLDYPWTFYPRTREELAALDCTFPVILKPAIKKGFNRFTHDKAWRVGNHEELLRHYDRACKLLDPCLIMVQEFVPGSGESQYSYAALCLEGQPLARLVARRVRQYPPDFGRSSSYVETLEQAEIERLAQRLLAAIHYTGLVEIEFKYDFRKDCYKLLDINPRIWGWHTLGRRAGVDFPYLLWRLCRGEPVPEVRGCPGVRWLRMVTDLPATALEMWRGNLSPRAYLQSLQGPIEFAIFATDDLLPALVEAPLLSYIAWKRRAA